MSLTIDEIMTMYNRDRDARQPVIDERIMDMIFSRWSQNEDQMSDVATTEFQGQFDIISREKRRIQSELRQNEIEVKFRSKTDDDDEADELLQGKYRTDRRLSKSRQCFQIAQDDQVDVGFGAWRLVTEDEDDVDTLSTNVEIRRKAIPEAVRRVFFDCNAVLLDKSDAHCCSVITSFTEKGYERFLEENEISTDDLAFTSFDQPYQSIYEQWVGIRTAYPLFSNADKTLSILEFFNLEPKRTVYYLYMDDEGQPYSIKREIAKDMPDLGEPIRKKTVIETECWKYITNGIDILKRTKVPGGKIPIIPVYGERNFVRGIENHYGIIKSARDPQCLINSVYNYLASMMMFSPVPKPEFDPREIEGVEEYHEGSANSHTLAYALRNKLVKDESTGETLDFRQATYTQPPQIPPAIGAMMQSLPGLTDSILNPGVTEDAFDTQASGVALMEINKQIGIQSFIYLDNFAEAMRRDGEIYACMAAEVFDTERKFVLTNYDGTTKEEVVNEEVYDFTSFDPESFEFESSKSKAIYGKRFDVQYDVGPSHQSKREATLANLKEIYQTLPDGDPIKKVVQLNILSREQGEGLDELNKYSRYELLAQGLPGFEPQNEDEEQFVQQLMQARGQEQGNPAAQLMAEQIKTERLKAETDARNETLKTQSAVEKDRAETRYKLAQAEEKELENQAVKSGILELVERVQGMASRSADLR